MRAILGLAACVVFAGCYHPSIKDGTIFCSNDGKCPSGFQCAADNLCYVHPPMFTPYGDGHLGAPTLASTGDVVLDTNTGAITQLDSTGAATVIVPAATGAFGVSQSNGPGVAIWSFTSLTIPTGVIVRVSPDSQNIPVLATTGALTVNGLIDLSGSGGTNGGIAENAPGTGGGAGAMSSSNGGGGGGGHAMMGSAGSGTGGGNGGVPFGATSLPLVVGAGGGGGAASADNRSAGLGGTGGGAIALLGDTVDIEGSINVSGRDGGKGVANDAGGGGGGAGGEILISGQTVTVGGGAVLKATGGTGGTANGMGGAGGNGSDGFIWLLGTVTNLGMTMPAAQATGPALTAFPK